MANFPLATLQLHLLEKVIQKLDFKSYYRLQRTCSKMLDFIRTMPTLSISNDRHYWPSYSRVTGSWKCMIRLPGKGICQTKGIFGLRVAILEITGENELLNQPDRFKSLCTFLKKHQITCTELQIDWESGITKEQYSTLLHIVKAEITTLLIDESDTYKGLYQPQSKILKKVSLHIDPYNLADVLKNIVPVYPELVLTVYDYNQVNFLCQSVLEILVHPLPKLRKFHFTCDYYSAPGSFIPWIEDNLKQIFQGHKTTKGTDEDGDDCTVVELPSHFPSGSSCIFSKGQDAVYIYITIPNRGEIK